MDIKRIFGENLRYHRKRIGMTQEQLSLQVQTAANHIAKLENGSKFASPELIARLSEALEIPPASLFYTTEANVYDDSFRGKVDKIICEEMNSIRKRIQELP